MRRTNGSEGSKGSEGSEELNGSDGSVVSVTKSSNDETSVARAAGNSEELATRGKGNGGGEWLDD